MFDIPIDLKLLEKQIIAYEQEPIVKGKIVFYGHSLFTRWGHPKWGFRRMDEDIRMKDGSLAVVNRGFGTSTSEELLYYYDRIVRPLEPRSLVIATFGNDTMYGYGPKDVMTNVSKLCHWARTDFPGIRIYLMEPTPAPKDKNFPRRDAWNSKLQMRRSYTEMLDIYAQTHEDTQVIHLWNRPVFFETPEDVGDYHKVREDIYAEDMGHFNQAGYDIFKEIILEALDDIL